MYTLIKTFVYPYHTPPAPQPASITNGAHDEMHTHNHMDVPSWTPSHVDLWLHHNNLDIFRSAFHDYQVNGSALLSISQSVLLDQFHIASFSLRARFMIALRQLKEDYEQYHKAHFSQSPGEIPTLSRNPSTSSSALEDFYFLNYSNEFRSHASSSNNSTGRTTPFDSPQIPLQTSSPMSPVLSNARTRYRHNDQLSPTQASTKLPIAPSKRKDSAQFNPAVQADAYGSVGSSPSSFSLRSAPAKLLQSKPIFLPRIDSLAFQTTNVHNTSLKRTSPQNMSNSAGKVLNNNNIPPPVPPPPPARSPVSSAMQPPPPPPPARSPRHRHYPSNTSDVVSPSTSLPVAAPPKKPPLKSPSTSSAHSQKSRSRSKSASNINAIRVSTYKSHPLPSLPTTIIEPEKSPNQRTPRSNNTSRRIDRTSRNNRDSTISIASRPRTEAIAENLDIFFPQANPEILKRARELVVLSISNANDGSPTQNPGVLNDGALGKQRLGRKSSLRVPKRTAASSNHIPKPPSVGMPNLHTRVQDPHLHSDQRKPTYVASPTSASPSSSKYYAAKVEAALPELPVSSAYKNSTPMSVDSSPNSVHSSTTSPKNRNRPVVPAINTTDLQHTRVNKPTPQLPSAPADQLAATPTNKFPGKDRPSAKTPTSSSTLGKLSAHSFPMPSPGGGNSALPSANGQNVGKEVMETTLLDLDGEPIEWIKGELIGLGSFGRVYLGLKVDTGEMMAVKLVEMPVAKGPGGLAMSKKNASMLEALQREIVLLRDLSHENIVHYFGFERNKDTLNVFLEYVPGGSLASLLGTVGTALPEEMTACFTQQIVYGVEYLHSEGILHRDLKCANVLVDDEGVCKISDFGLSKRMEGGAVAGADRSDATKGDGNPNNLLKTAYDYFSQHSMQGSVYWMAPEVVRGRGYSAKVDIWSLGCIVIEMVTGSRPWVGFNEIAAMYHIGSAKKPEIPESVCGDARDFLDVCFELDPQLRPKASELAQLPFVVNADSYCDYRGFVAQFEYEE